jgi:hypothetical protein
MSEIPSLAVAFAASWAFLQWLESGRARWCGLAFGMAGVAFLCRVTTAGVLPGWLLYVVLSGRTRRLRSPAVVLAAIIYLGLGVVWTWFVSQFNKYELAADGKGNGLSWNNLLYFQACLPALLRCGTTLPAFVGAGLALRLWRRSPAGLFWLAWLASYTLFKLAVVTSPEPRHFLTAMPACAGLVVCLFHPQVMSWVRGLLAPLLTAIGVVVNILLVAQLPSGLVGYAPVAEQLNRLKRPGNVLLACWEDQDFIFRYRACSPSVDRRFIRGDRSLAIRLPVYANVAPVALASTREDLLAVIRKGRIRYLLTCFPRKGMRDWRTDEMRLAHDVAVSLPHSFRLLGQHNLIHEFEKPARQGSVFLWEFRGELPAGPCEIPVIIPTAGLQYSSAK